MSEEIVSVDQMELIRRLYPLRRDLVSDGYDEAIRVLSERFPLVVHEYASGTTCWTWTVPDKWTCDEAFVETPAGRRIIDQKRHPLHVASYSQSIDATITRDELLEHLHVHPHLHDVPPFVYYYYQHSWGFACGRSVRDALSDGKCRAVIRSRFEPGHLKVAEYHLPGECDECFVLCGHLCHPAQANDGLSGVVTGLAVMNELAQRHRRYSYRLLIVPETIGSVAWLSHHESLFDRLVGGLFLEMTGLPHAPALQLSYSGDTQVDRCLRIAHIAAERAAWCGPHRGIVGNDERQFNAPGVRIPMLSYSRALPWGHRHRPFREYHSAADTPDIARPEMLERSKQAVLTMIEAWERNHCPRNLFKGEVCLASCNLAVDRHRDLASHRQMLAIMDMIDGTNAIADIADRLDIEQGTVARFVDELAAAGLVSLDGPVRETTHGVSRLAAAAL